MPFETLRRDARMAVRSLWRTPVFTLTAIAAITLGLGATTAILSVVNGVLLRPLPYADADRLVVILHDGSSPVAPANFLDWRDQTRSFAAMGAAELWSPDVTGDADAEEVAGLRITASVPPMLGVRPLFGRWFTAAEEAGAERVVVIGHALWQRRFGGRASAIGRPISLNGEPYTVVGVMPASFRFAPFWATGSELWAPLRLGPRAIDRNGQSLRIFARLAAGVSVAAAQRDLDRVTSRLERELPGTNRNVRVVPLRDKVIGDMRKPLMLLLAAVLLVFLIACANVAHMLLARGTMRVREMAVRTAMGATRGRLAAQMLIESACLSIAGAAGGLALAWCGVRLFMASRPEMIPRVASVAIDSAVLLMATALAVTTTLLSGLVPALQGARVDAAAAFRDGGRGASDGARRQGVRDALVVSELALALVLLFGAVLLGRSFTALRHVDPGFDASHVVTMRIGTTGTPAADPARHALFYEEAMARVRALPMVENASFINHIPIAGDAWGLHFRIDGRPTPRAGDWPRATYRVVLPGYFSTMRIPLLRGRDVAATDRLDASRVVVINEYTARKYWAGADPIGKRIVLDDSTMATVVGVAKNTVRQDWSGTPEEELFFPFLQSPDWMAGGGPRRSMTLVARVRCESTACDRAARDIRAAIDQTQPNAPVSAVQTMAAIVDAATSDARVYAALLAAFAVIAVTLAAMGVYGVMSFAVSRRRQELGIRIALGAEPSAVVRMVVARGLRLAIGGVAGGALLAAIGAPLLRGLLYGLRVEGPLAFLAATATLAVVALLASGIPARRAARIDPLEAMRAD